MKRSDRSIPTGVFISNCLLFSNNLLHVLQLRWYFSTNTDELHGLSVKLTLCAICFSPRSILPAEAEDAGH